MCAHTNSLDTCQNFFSIGDNLQNLYTRFFIEGILYFFYANTFHKNLAVAICRGKTKLIFCTKVFAEGVVVAVLILSKSCLGVVFLFIICGWYVNFIGIS